MASSASDDQNGDESIFSRYKAWWTVFALTFVSFLDWVDRAVIGVIAEPIKGEFGLTDTQLGFLMGAAIGLFRLAVSVPVGRLADTRNRRNIVGLSIVLVSSATVAFGLAKNFAHLLLARVTVGISTAGLNIPALSIISDLFPLRRRGQAMGVWNLGGAIGGAAGLAIVGFYSERYGWRLAVTIIGIFGLVVALLFLASVREPSRRDSAGKRIVESASPSFIDVFKFLRRQISFRHVAAGFFLLTAIDMIAYSWAIPFFMRSHGMSIGEISAAVSLAFLVGGIPGTFLGGYLLDILGKLDLRWHAWLMIIVAIIASAIDLLVYILPSAKFALAVLTIHAFLLALTYAPATTIPINLAGAQMRAVSYATYSMAMYGGFAFGPFLVGFLSTQMSSDLGQESLRYALIISIGLLIWAALHFLLASRTIVDDYNRADLA